MDFEMGILERERACRKFGVTGQERIAQTVIRVVRGPTMHFARFRLEVNIRHFTVVGSLFAV